MLVAKLQAMQQVTNAVTFLWNRKRVVIEV